MKKFFLNKIEGWFLLYFVDLISLHFYHYHLHLIKVYAGLNSLIQLSKLLPIFHLELHVLISATPRRIFRNFKDLILKSSN